MRKRSKFNLSSMNLFSARMGLLIPIGIQEVLPGDTFQHSTSLFMRLAPLVAPTMHPCNVRIHHWYIPTRLLWPDFESFITGGADGLDDTIPPFIVIPENGFGISTLGDYLGIPTETPAGTEVSALPFRAYNFLWNECYRDQDLQPELVNSLESGLDTTSNTTLQRADWEKDYFTTARPWPQKGADVTVPVDPSGTPSIVLSGRPGFEPWPDPPQSGFKDQFLVGGTPALNGGDDSVGLYLNNDFLRVAGMTDISDSGTGSITESKQVSGAVRPTKGTLAASLDSNLSLGNIRLSDIREAYAIQRFQEARGNYGSRYTEYLRYYGIRPSDTRLQRPEFLGGSKSVIQFSEVLQTSQSTADSPLGKLAGHGMAASRSPRYRRWFEEHGFVVSVLTVRPKAIYAQGLNRMWTRKTKYDYFTPELQSIGDQEILNKELYAASADPDGVFGYQERYQEYKASQSQIHGEMRTVLDEWHMARIFENQPVLNGDFVNCNPTDRIFAAQENDQLYCMAQHNIIARRMVKR